MLAQSSYTQEYIDACRKSIAADIAAYRRFIKASGAARDAVSAFEPTFFNNLIFALDGYFLHRQRSVEGKDGNPINEVRVLCSSMLNNGAKMRTDATIKMKPDSSVLGYATGDPIRLTEKDFSRLSDAYFDEISRRFCEISD